MVLLLLRYCTNRVHVDKKLHRNKSKDLTELTSHENWYILKMNVSYIHIMKFSEVMGCLLPQGTKMKRLFNLCLPVIL